MAKTKLIVGLGNPGREYAETRHNIGFIALDNFAKGLEGSWKEWHSLAEVFDACGLFEVKLAKPLLYMNNSGEPVIKLMRYFDIKPEEILVISDDFSIPLGTIRLRSNGSCGGHNGLASILNILETNTFPRLRLGIGPLPEKIDPADFVLSRFTKAELKTVNIVLKNALEVISNVLSLGLEKAASKISNNLSK